MNVEVEVVKLALVQRVWWITVATLGVATVAQISADHYCCYITRGFPVWLIVTWGVVLTVTGLAALFHPHAKWRARLQFVTSVALGFWAIQFLVVQHDSLGLGPVVTLSGLSAIGIVLTADINGKK